MPKRYRTRPYRTGASSSQKRVSVQVGSESAQDSKANPQFAGSITYTNAPEPHMLPRNYKAYAREGFRGDPTLYKSVMYLITNGAAIPPVLFTDATCKTRIEQHPLLDKLEHPNPEQTGVDYRESVMGHLLIAGNSFQLALRAGKSGPPDELWTLPPYEVHPITQKPRGVVGYNFDGYDDANNPIPPEQIRHDKFWSPDPDEGIFGLSPVEPAAILIDQNMAARKWNLSVLQNSGRMDGAWVAPAPMSPNDRKKLQDQLNGKYRGAQNAGKIPVLDAGMDFKSTGYTPTELDWLEAIRRNEGGIANVVNMPPQLIGDTSASTYNNMTEAKSASYTEAIFPVLDRVYAGWRHWLLPMYPDLADSKGRAKAYLYYDKQSIEVVQQAIQAQRDAQFKRAVAAWLQGAITLNEARDICGLPPIPGGDVFRFGAVIVRSSELDTYAEQSLTKPAAPPFPQPEPLNAPDNGAPGPGGNASDGKEPEPQKTAHPHEDKSAWSDKRDAEIEQQLDALSERSVTHLRWVVDGHPCATCLENDGVTVEVGDEFPSGDLMPPVHPNCECTLIEYSQPGFGMMRKPADFEQKRAERAKRREEYRAFMQEVL